MRPLSVKEEPQEMRKDEAAKYVGCSVRSLENYTKQGRIGVKYERSKTRPVALYSRTELDRLKAELNSTLYAPAVTRQEEGKREAIVKRELAPDLALILSRLFDALQEQAGKEREPSILELAQMPLLKLKEAQRYANLSRAELVEAIEDKKFKATRMGGEWKIRREVLEEYIRKNF
jgi:excisionase family DNA binding protein